MPGVCAADWRCAVDRQLHRSCRPYLPDWMHQSRSYRPDLFRCSSAAVACSAASVFVAGRSRERGTNGRDPATATTAMWPAVWHGGRPAGRRATTRRIDHCNNAAAPAEAKSWDKLPATGRWRTNKRQRVDAAPAADTAAARTKPGRAARGVTGAEHLARHLPNPAAVRPFFLLRSVGLVRRGQFIG